MPSSRPLVARTAELSAFYIPALADPPPVEPERLQILAADKPVPVVRIASPRYAPPLLPSGQERVLLTIDPDVVGEPATRIGVLETTDNYLRSLAESLRRDFQRGHPPPAPSLERLKASIAEHLRDSYFVWQRKRQRQGLSPARLAKVLALIEERSATGLSVAEMADCVHLSPFHFTRMFRRSTGYAPHEYITLRRLERAKELLRTTDRLMGDIARVVGYKNQAHFTRVFHANVGMTPRRMRAQAREGAGPPRTS